MSRRNSWQWRYRPGRGGGREFNLASLPELVRTALALNLDRADSSMAERRGFASRGCAFDSRSARSFTESTLSDAVVPLLSSCATPRDGRADDDGAERVLPPQAPEPATATDISFGSDLNADKSLLDAVPPLLLVSTTPRDSRADDDDARFCPPLPASKSAASGNSEKESQRKLLWEVFERATDSKKEIAMRRAAVARTVGDRAEVAGWTRAYKEAAAELGLPIPTVRRWSEACREFDRADYPAVFIDMRQGRARDAAYSERIWDLFYADYGRQEEPAAMAVYRRVEAIAASENLAMPKYYTLIRRWQKLPRRVQMLLRKGPRACATTYPHQTRSVAHFHAMQACNADGHICDVFVRWPDGEVGRPILAVIQDLYSRMIVAWRLGKTESGDLVRMTYFDAIEKFGVFDKVYLDNGRAWMTKEMTAGMSHRYRFRKRNALEDFKGVLTFLGIHPIAVKPAHGQSKPIERSFGDFCTEKIARHPLCAGAYTGNTPNAKPENYGSKAIPLADFQKLVDAQIALHNRQPGRRTEVCRGMLSFEQAFMESWKTLAPRMLAPSQKFLFLLKTEPVMVRKPVGEIELFGNRFSSAAVAELAGHRVIARFDPQHIRAGIRVYRLDGAFVGEAECIEPVGYDDLDAARDHNRAVRAHVKAARDYSAAEARITDAEFRRLNGVTPEPPLRPRPAATRIIPDAPRTERELPRANNESVKRMQRLAAAAKEQTEERRRSGTY